MLTKDKDLTISCFIADSRHNLSRINPLTGNYIGLPEHAIRKYERIICDDAEREVRMHGKFKYLSGRVWKMWDRDIHTISRTLWIKDVKNVIVNGQPPQHWPRCMVIDPHDQKPHALIWVAKDPEYQSYYVYREAWLVNKTFRQVCEHIRNVELDSRERVGCRVMDPNFGPKTQGNTRMSVRETFEVESEKIQYPMRFMMGNDNIPLGHKKVEEMLWYDIEKPISIINQPSIYICDDLEKCIYQIEHYVWPDIADDKPDQLNPRPIKKHDDFPANLRYLSLSNWTGVVSDIIEGIGNAYE